MATTRFGLGGPSSAYAGFSAKAASALGVNNRCKRASIVSLLVPSTLAPVEANDGSFDHGERQSIAKTYCGILSIKHYSLTADSGTYVWTGVDLSTNLGVTTTVGAYIWTGVTLSANISVTTTVGTYTWTGLFATLRIPNTCIRIANAQFVDLGVRMSNPRFKDTNVRIANAVFGDLNVRISNPRKKT
jgi:hypothetical protein